MLPRCPERRNVPIRSTRRQPRPIHYRGRPARRSSHAPNGRRAHTMTLRTSNSAVLRLAASQGLAYAGRGAAMTALIWELYQTSHSSWLVSAAMLGVFGVSTAVSPWAGHVGDRHDRRAVVVISALLAALGFLGCAVLADLHLTLALV